MSYQISQLALNIGIVLCMFGFLWLHKQITARLRALEQWQHDITATAEDLEKQ